MKLYDDATCYRCGTNAWTSCEHREATREAPVVEPYKDKRERARMGTGGGRYTIRPAVMQGLNFRNRKPK